MKFLLLAAIAAIVVWLWRHNRQSEQQERQQAAAAARAAAKPGTAVTEIVACAVCQVHLPRTDALPAGNGFYCSEAHRLQAGGTK